MENRCIDLNTVNRAKRESLEQTGQLLFGEVYEKAKRLLEDIICQSYRVNGFDEQASNVISFLGARGRGKTSAMLSFLFWLKELRFKPDAGCKFEKPGYGAAFYTLPYIDAATLAGSEYVLDVVLANMWGNVRERVDYYYGYANDANFQHLQQQTMAGFSDVRGAYLVLKKREHGEPDMDGEFVPVTSTLQKLSASMNLRRELQKLVRNYIALMDYHGWEGAGIESRSWENTCIEGYGWEGTGIEGPGLEHRGQECPGVGGRGWGETGEGRKTCFLVIAVDDVDMSAGMAQRILEEIRRFLSIPEIIVLLTADIDRLKIMCEGHYKKYYENGRDCYRFVNDYLEKILPYNMRVNLPELQENAAGYRIEKGGLKTMYENCDTSQFREKDWILKTIAVRCGIYFDGVRRGRHFMQSHSLREMVNYFEQLVKVGVENGCEWLRFDLANRLMERITDESQRAFIKWLFSLEESDWNSAVVRYIAKYLQDGNYGKYAKKMAKMLRNRDDTKSLGQVLFACSMMEEADIHNVEFVNAIFVLYATALAQAEEKTRRKITGCSIWGDWEYGIIDEAKPVEQIAGMCNRGKLALYCNDETSMQIRNRKLEEAVDDIFEQNKEAIFGWLYTWLFIDIGEMPWNWEEFVKVERQQTDADNRASEDMQMDMQDLVGHVEKYDGVESDGKETDGLETDNPKTDKASQATLETRLVNSRLPGHMQNETEDRSSKNQENIQSWQQKAAPYAVYPPMDWIYRNYILGFLCSAPQEDTKKMEYLLTQCVNGLMECVCSEAEDNIGGWGDPAEKLVKKYKEMLKKNGPKADKLPIQNIEILYSVGKEFARRSTVSGEKAAKMLYEKIADKYKTIWKELEKRDQYYEKLGEHTDFEDKFADRVQSRIFLEPDFLDPGTKECFQQQFYAIYRAFQPR